MKKIQVPTREQVDAKSQAIFDQLKKQLGIVPNLYATIGYSSEALEAFLNFSGSAGKGSFTGKEIEAIKLAVSEANECKYCLAAHTALAKNQGFTQEETLELRATSIQDERLQAITTLARDITLNRARVNPANLERFYAQGFEEKGLIDLIAVVHAISFTNYTHILTDVPVDFPKAAPLPVEV